MVRAAEKSVSVHGLLRNLRSPCRVVQQAQRGQAVREEHGLEPALLQSATQADQATDLGAAIQHRPAIRPLYVFKLVMGSTTLQPGLEIHTSSFNLFRRAGSFIYQYACTCSAVPLSTKGSNCAQTAIDVTHS